MLHRCHGNGPERVVEEGLARGEAAAAEAAASSPCRSSVTKCRTPVGSGERHRRHANGQSRRLSFPDPTVCGTSPFPSGNDACDRCGVPLSVSSIGTDGAAAKEEEEEEEEEEEGMTEGSDIVTNSFGRCILSTGERERLFSFALVFVSIPVAFLVASSSLFAGVAFLSGMAIGDASGSTLSPLSIGFAEAFMGEALSRLGTVPPFGVPFVADVRHSTSEWRGGVSPSFARQGMSRALGASPSSTRGGPGRGVPLRRRCLSIERVTRPLSLRSFSLCTGTGWDALLVRACPTVAPTDFGDVEEREGLKGSIAKRSRGICPSVRVSAFLCAGKSFAVRFPSIRRDHSEKKTASRSLPRTAELTVAKEGEGVCNTGFITGSDRVRRKGRRSWNALLHSMSLFQP